MHALDALALMYATTLGSGLAPVPWGESPPALRLRTEALGGHGLQFAALAADARAAAAAGLAAAGLQSAAEDFVCHTAASSPDNNHDDHLAELAAAMAVDDDAATSAGAVAA